MGAIMNSIPAQDIKLRGLRCSSARILTADTPNAIFH